MGRCPFTTFCQSAAVVFVCYKILSKFKRKCDDKKHIQHMIDSKREERQIKRRTYEYDKIGEHLSAQDFKSIINMRAIEVLDSIEDGSYKCFDIVSAFCKQSLRANDLYNCLADELYEQALVKAKEVDELKSQGLYDRNEYPLLGLPISVKEIIEVAGTDCTFGLAHRLHNPCNADGALVRTLRQAGAIIFAKTVNPPLLMLPESSSEIWGYCKNPFNVDRTSGGSSGGESALIAARGSCAGIGSDIGGSGRIPSNFCGIVGFKPTPIRSSTMGFAKLTYFNGQEAIKPTQTPMTRSVEDCVLILKVLWGPLMLAKDRRMPPLQFREEEYSKQAKMKIGYTTGDGFFDASPTAVRAVKEAVAALKKSGHECVPIEVPDGFNRSLLYLKIMASDGYFQRYMDALKGTGEELYKTYYFIKFVACIPTCIRPLLASFLNLIGETRAAIFTRELRKRDVTGYWKLCSEKIQIQKRFDEWFKEAGISALITPSTALPAYQHTKSSDLAQAVSYAFAYNLLDVPAGVVPVTTVKREEDGDYTSEFDDLFTKKARKVTEGSTGLPVGVQVVTLQYEDEKCLSVMRDIENQLNIDLTPPDLLD